jgi:hypothetical protein
MMVCGVQDTIIPRDIKGEFHEDHAVRCGGRTLIDRPLSVADMGQYNVAVAMATRMELS